MTKIVTFATIPYWLKPTLVDRRVRAGYKRSESAQLLDQLNGAHQGAALASALVYHSFMPVRAAERVFGL